MLQAVTTNPGKITLREVDRPKPAPGEVIIRVKRIGVCGSDIHIYHGLHPYVSYPLVQGHEVSGIIEEVGAQVTKLAVGDQVTFMPQVTCGECYPCRHGLYHICDHLKVMGAQTGGAAQEYFPVNADRVLKLPALMTLDQAAMIEPVSVAAHALARAGGVEGLRVVVLGAGTIGNLVGQVAKASGACAVMITDVSDYKLEIAKRCGLDVVVNTARDNLGEAVQQNFGPDKADLILECVGVQPTITQAVANARKGSTIVIVGVFGRKPAGALGLVQERELSLMGTLMYQKKDFARAISLVSAGKLSLDKMVTHRFPFKRYAEAYETIESSKGNYMKVIIDV